MAVAPHALAAQSALEVLREGGNAIEATIAAAATSAVVYPHLNSIGGDGCWLIHVPGHAPGAIVAAGAAAARASIDWYHERGAKDVIPVRGALAANTVAGTVSGWGLAHALSRRVLGGRMPFSRLIADAIYYAREGVPLTLSQVASTAKKAAELVEQPGYARTFLTRRRVPRVGQLFFQKRLADTLDRLAKAGTEDFYRGELSRAIARDLERVGSPLSLGDLNSHRARLADPLHLRHRLGTLYNTGPPSQGLVALLVLAILEELKIGRTGTASPDFVHLAVEAVKQVLRVRDRCLEDPRYMSVPAKRLLTRRQIRELAAGLDRRRAAPWHPHGHPGRGPGEAVWIGVVDPAGRGVSFIQSLHHEFGCGVVLEHTGINWQNRGSSFLLDQFAPNALSPRKEPLNTLNPPLALLKDGRLLVYGAMGGDGEPQTESAVFTRIVHFGMDAQAAVSAPRWLFDPELSAKGGALKLEARFEMRLAQALMGFGHEVEILEPFDESVGHAGAIVRHASGALEGGADPRSDGSVAAY
jgi:oxamate amidohydrolase